MDEQAGAGERPQGRIVVGVDGSEHSLRALRWALEEASFRKARLEAVTAWHTTYTGDVGFGGYAPIDPAQLEAGARVLLEDALEQVSADASSVPVESVVVEGTAAQALLATAKGADLLVVGNRGRGGFRGLLLGSVSSQCVHHAPCPVVVIPHEP
jgi:nucleotide-binding universal stress UspA family protein